MEVVKESIADCVIDELFLREHRIHKHGLVSQAHEKGC